MIVIGIDILTTCEIQFIGDWFQYDKRNLSYEQFYLPKQLLFNVFGSSNIIRKTYGVR